MTIADRSSDGSCGDEDLLAAIKDTGGVPRHVAIIMDGNGRWARRRWLPRVAGHRAGRHSVRRAVRACRRIGVEVLTLYTFSQENWKRPASEVKALWSFLRETLTAELKDLDENNVRLVATGDLDSIPEAARASLLKGCEKLSGNDGLVLNLALAYGGRAEIVHAATEVARRVAAGELAVDDIDEETLRGGLYRPELPDPDLVIRTSGEFRLSNFLLWQVAYAEFHLTTGYWPDFQERDLLLAVRDYQGRDRRYGGLREKSNGSDDSYSSPNGIQRWVRMLRRGS